MALSDFDKRQTQAEIQKLDEKLQSSELARKDLARRLEERDKTVRELERALGIHERLTRVARNPDWLIRPPAPSKKAHGIWNAMLSDLHLDEVVNPSEIFGLNSYNREIAAMRLQATFENIVRVAFHWHAGFTIDGLVLPLGGDLFSGNIHDELRRTNDAPILDTIDYWIDPMVQGIEMLADQFGKVHIPVVVGNHGRFDRKPVAKLRARENYDWFFAKAIARCVNDRGIKNVTFDISDSADVTYKTYDKTTMMTHGDQASGGSGWGGIMSPIMRLDDKKTRRQAAVQMPYDYLIIGHWHSLTWLPRGVVNGSLKGLDEYAFQGNFGYEDPQQAMWLMQPGYGRTFTAPVFCQDPVAEGWKEAS